MKVTFNIDARLLNQHFAASSHDATRISMMNTVMFRGRGTTMDIVSTSGRIMFWTRVDAPVVDGVPVNWEAVSVRFTGNGKKVVQERRGKCVAVTLDMDARKCEVNDWSSGSVMVFPFSEEPFPSSWEQVANAGQKSSFHSVYEPALLKAVEDYIGEAFGSPEGTVPQRWTLDSRNEKRVALLMPCGNDYKNRGKSLACKMVEAMRELAEGSSKARGCEVMKRVLGIVKEYAEVNPYDVEKLMKHVSFFADGQKGESDAE